MCLPDRAAVKVLERLRARRHVTKTSQPDKSVWIIQVPELTDDLHPERFLRFDKFPVEQIDQHIPLPWMHRVLPQLNDRAASFCRRRIRLFHWENLRRERSRCHQEFRRAQDRHVKTKIIPQLRIVSRLRSMRSDNQSQSLETFSSQSFLRNASRKKILSKDERSEC